MFNQSMAYIGEKIGELVDPLSVSPTIMIIAQVLGYLGLRGLYSGRISTILP